MPQFGIFAQGTQAHHFLEFDLKPRSDANVGAAVRRLLAPGASSGRVNVVVAFGARLWGELAPGIPVPVSEFREVLGKDGKRAPATQHDLWVWLSGSGWEATAEAAGSAKVILRDLGLAAEQPAAIYGENRDMGFLDGTANPPQHQAADVALVPEGTPGAGGSHVLAMKWAHNMVAFNRLSLEEQEHVFGRTKKDSVEMPDGVRPVNAHISRVTVKEGGEELKIYRRSVPFGTREAQEGLYFLAFSSEPARYEKMLARMFGVSADGTRDRLTDFTRPVSGAFYFAPSLNALAEAGLAPPPAS